MKITIEKIINKAGDKQTLRLVYWYNSYKDETGKLKHSRRREQLDLYLHPKPKTTLERNHNRETLQTVEQIKSKRIAEAAAGQHGFTDTSRINGSFYSFFNQFIATKTKDDGKFSVWDATLAQLKRFHPDEGLTFEQITPGWLEGVRNFFDSQAKTKTGNPISRGSASVYFSKVRSVINAAHKKGILSKNPLTEVASITPINTARVYLEIDEVKALAKTDCKYQVLKRAFLFSCLTGLRSSDIHKLTWEEVSQFNGTNRITFNQKKTEGLQYLDLTPQAYSLLGEASTGRIFQSLKNNSYFNTELLRWCMAAGITKHVTFHSARHTFAVSLLSNGVDIYTVSKLMGHTSIKTTLIYADIVSKTKKDAMHAIPDIF